MTEPLEQLKEMRAKMDALKTEEMKIARSVFDEMCKAVFVKHPELTSFSWTQYTPGFNDGDPCYFGVHDVRSLNDVDLWDIEEEDYEKWKVCERDVNKLISTFTSDEMEFMFGEGRVHCDVDGKVEVDYCDTY